jgi:hypothetical protein
MNKTACDIAQEIRDWYGDGNHVYFELTEEEAVRLIEDYVAAQIAEATKGEQDQ